jgi:predicted aldo/keto reductase-like oxidoreductase
MGFIKSKRSYYMEDVTMNEQEKKDILIAQAETGLFCNGCNNCLPGCKKNLPVPEIMRAYMYAYGYSSFDQAYNLLSDLKTGDNPCNECDTCTVNCVKNFKVKEKIADISRIVNVPAEFIA